MLPGVIRLLRSASCNVSPSLCPSSPTASTTTAAPTALSGRSCRDENTKAGIRNFTIVLFANHAIGLLECDDWDAASAYLDKSDVQARWQAEHEDILDVDTASGLVPLQMLEELFHQD